MHRERDGSGAHAPGHWAAPTDDDDDSDWCAAMAPIVRRMDPAARSDENARTRGAGAALTEGATAALLRALAVSGAAAAARRIDWLTARCSMAPELDEGA